MFYQPSNLHQSNNQCVITWDNIARLAEIIERNRWNNRLFILIECMNGYINIYRGLIKIKVFWVNKYLIWVFYEKIAMFFPISEYT